MKLYSILTLVINDMSKPRPQCGCPLRPTGFADTHIVNCRNKHHCCKQLEKESQQGEVGLCQNYTADFYQNKIPLTPSVL